MHDIAIITMARAGSKRCPDKIIREYKGKPLYLWTVETALQLGYPYFFLHDYDVLDMPASVTVIKRLPEFAGDVHKTCQEILWTGINAEIYIFLQCTSPRRDVGLLKSYIKHFVESGYNAGVCAKRLRDKFYYVQKDEIFNRVNFEQLDRSDNGCDKNSVLKETGSFYIFKKCQLEKKHIMDTGDYYVYDDLYDVDIDTEEDFEN